MFIDSHAHITSSDLALDLKQILQRAQANNIHAIVNICTNNTTLTKGIELTKKYPWIFNTAATTPHDVEREGEIFFPTVVKYAQNGKLVAIGETGLDYHYNYSDPKIQQIFLRQYLQLALETKLPVIIHCRKAFQDFFRILDEEYKINNRYGPGVLHCFTGSLEEAQEVLSRGWYLSLSGIVTFKKSTELKEVARIVPLNRLLIETDSPYLAPQSRRGKKNEPSFLPETAALIASIKGTSIEQLAEATTKNAQSLFSLPTALSYLN